MKKNYLVIAAIAMGCTAICAAGITAGAALAADRATSTFAVPSDPAEYDQWCNSWSKPGHLYFHYKRKGDSGYNKYALWLWPFYPDSLEGTLWGFEGKEKQATVTLKPMSKVKMTQKDVGGTSTKMFVDDYGVIFDVDLTKSLVGGKTGIPVSFDGCKEIGFLLPNVDSMSGETNWVSDGGIENYIDGYGDDANWRAIKGGKTLHIFTASGALDKHSFSATGGAPAPKDNPIDTDTTDTGTSAGKHRSKVDPINQYKPEMASTSTSEAFKNTGVGYQIFVASFRDSNGDGLGDINGIRQSLDYLDDLGVDCLWLTPVNQSGSYHGYDVIDYTKIDKRFGTEADFRALVREAHARGMKVLMDLVLNHTSKNNVWFQNSLWGVNSGLPGADSDDTGINWRDVYSWRYQDDPYTKARVEYDSANGKYVIAGYDNITIKDDAESDNPSWYRIGESKYYYYGKFGSGMPEINYENEATRKLVIDTAKHWLDFDQDNTEVYSDPTVNQFGIDGYRLDAVKHIYMNDEVGSSFGDTVIVDVGEKESYDEERGQYIKKKFDYCTNLTKNLNWWKEFADKIKTDFPNCFLVGENFDGWGTRTAPYYQALDSQFDFSNYYHVPAWIYNTDSGASSFETTENNGGQAAETYNAFASYDNFTLGDTGVTVRGGCRPDFINGAFTSNHDVMRLINQANGVGSKDSTTANDNVPYNNPWVDGQAKFQAAVTLLNPGLSWIYYGDELGMSSNTYQHIQKYGSENNMDIWYRQPFLWKDKASRANYKANQYKFELDSHNKHLLNNDEGIDYKPIVDNTGKVTGHEKLDTLSSFYPFYKKVIEIKKAYPRAAKIEYRYCSYNVLRIHVWGEGSKELEIFINNGRSDSEYRIMLDGSYSFLAATEGAPTQINGDIGHALHGVTAFVKGA